MVRLKDLTLPDTDFFDLPIPGGGPSRPMACKIFAFYSNGFSLGTNNIDVTLRRIIEINLSIEHNDDDVSTLKKWSLLIGCLLKSL